MGTKRIFMTVFISLFFILPVIGSSHAADTGKIGFYDFKKVYDTVYGNKYAGEGNPSEKYANSWRNRVVAAAEKIGKREGFSYLFEKRGAGAVYYPSTADITDKIIQHLKQTPLPGLRNPD